MLITNNIPETNHVSRVYTVTAVLYWQFVLHVMSFRILYTFCTFALGLSEARVHAKYSWFFFSSLIWCIHGMLLTY
jgi:hypothetical protein